MDSTARQVGNQLKKELFQLYGNNLASLILFGSHARGDFDEESDIDFAIVLRDETISPTSEILRITPLSTPIQIENNVLISLLPVSEKRLLTSQQPVYQSIRSEGIKI
ncbi:nucleotidyltransferase domain-containing protein [Runella salmonicolor]|uniref:Nucleotidyltransferase domain-containing protein n=1 Tax=Runella salmonicolor TaxID=2950278 RepID=A0ABT1FIB4_9BACT|nr:nucleotidyltransferase domain-containing protein [Runella salmonicolor]MCP1381511.1 nucleotidyltransferase domain-containing protein [Runella salmonicolor]